MEAGGGRETLAHESKGFAHKGLVRRCQTRRPCRLRGREEGRKEGREGGRELMSRIPQKENEKAIYVLCSFLPSFLPACLPACPPPIPSNSRLILLFCITKDKSNLDLSLSLLPAKNGHGRPATDRPSDRPSDSGGGATSWLGAGAILRSISLRSVAPSLRTRRRRRRRNIRSSLTSARRKKRK